MSKVQSRPELESRFGAVSFGAFLIIVAVTWMYHPWLPSEILAYFRSFEAFGHPVAPPPVLFKPAIFFAYVLGIWLLVLAAIRALARVGGVSSDATGGAFWIFCGYLLGLYVQGGISEWTIIPVIIIFVGILITISSLVKAVLKR